MANISITWSPKGYVLMVDGKACPMAFQSLSLENYDDMADITPFNAITKWLNKIGFADGDAMTQVKKEIFAKRMSMGRTHPLCSIGLDPKMLDKYMEHESRYVKHDLDLRHTVFLTCLSAYSSNPINLFVRGPSSIGKTYGVLKTVQYFPPEDVYLLGGLSPTALVHDYGKLYDTITDMEVSPSDVDWKDTVAVSRLKNVIELSNKTLVFLEAPKIETYQILRPILSHDAWETKFSFTEKTGKGTMRTKHVYLRGFPATISCSVNPSYQEELATRSINITPEMTEEKYKDAIQLQGKKSAEPWLFPNPDPMLIDYKYTLKQIKTKMADYECVIPYGEELGNCYPHQLSRDMRDFNKLTTLINQVTFLHIYQRPCIKNYKYGDQAKPQTCRSVVLSTLQDFFIASKIFLYFSETTRSGLPGNVISFFNEVMVPLNELYEHITQDDITKKWFEIYRTSRSKSVLKQWYLDPLREAGWIDEEDDKEDGRRKNIKVCHGIKEMLHEFSVNLILTFGEEKLTKWKKGMLEVAPDAMPELNGNELDWDEFIYLYLNEWVEKQ